MKRILNLVLVLCLLLGVMPQTAFALDYVNIFNVTVTEPKAGQFPTYEASLPKNASTYVEKVEWEGDLDVSGRFADNESYTVKIKVCVKDNIDRYIKHDAKDQDNGRVKVNGKVAELKYISEDKRSAFIYYKFDTYERNGTKAKTITYDLDGDEFEETPNFSEFPTYVEQTDIFVTEPVLGAKPATVATVAQSDILKVKSLKWYGEFDDNDCFMANERYELTITIAVKNSVNKVYSEKRAERPVTFNGVKEGAKGISTVYPQNTKQMTYKVTYTIEQPTSIIDASRMYSPEEADEKWSDLHMGEVIINEEMMEQFSIYDVNRSNPIDSYFNYIGVDNANRIERLLIDYEDMGSSGDFLRWDHNLKEVWISPRVDVVEMLSHYESNPRQANYLYYSGNGNTYDLTLFVSDTSLPNGYAEGWSNRDWDLDGNVISVKNVTSDKHLRFKTMIYSGDVYEAFKKGASCAREWCPGHVYDGYIQTADRLKRQYDCAHTIEYYFSCSICGKCEYDPNHTFSMNEYREFTTTKGVHVYEKRDLSDKNFIGLNPKGDKVYLFSCIYCGINPYEAATTYYTEEDHRNAFGGAPEMSRLDYIEREKKNWAEVIIPSRLKGATLEKDTTQAFAVKSGRDITANVSDWAKNEVSWAAQNDLLDFALLGNDYTHTINRLQFASIAVKLAEKLTGREIPAAPANTFADTTDNYVLKAYAAGITSGVSANAFDPYGTLNRQQMATFLYRTLDYVKHNSAIRYTTYDSALGNYTDSWAIQDWAKESMAFMNALGLVKGVTNTELNPDGNCTIEQAILVANRGVTADQIGWYQCVLDSEKNIAGVKGGHDNKRFFYGPSGALLTQTSYRNGDRIWVNGEKCGAPTGTTAISAFVLPTFDTYTGHQAWVPAEDFRAIKDLLPEDYAVYNQNK